MLQPQSPQQAARVEVELAVSRDVHHPNVLETLATARARAGASGAWPRPQVMARGGGCLGTGTQVNWPHTHPLLNKLVLWLVGYFDALSCGC